MSCRDISLRPRKNRVTHPQSPGLQNIALLTVCIRNERDVCSPIRIVLYLCYAPGDAVFVSLKVDLALPALVSSTFPPGRHPAVVIPTTGATQSFSEGALGSPPCDF